MTGGRNKEAEARACIYCKHAIKPWLNQWWACRRAVTGVDPVCGNNIVRSCEKEREDGYQDRCGPTGVHFEPKDKPAPSLGERIMGLIRGGGK